MSFETILQGIVNECGGGLGAALIETDGIPIVQVVSDSGLGEDLSVAGAEFARVLGDVRKASDALAGGAVLETVVMLSRFTLIFRNVDEDIMLVVALAPDGNLGKARYLIRRYMNAIREEL